MRNKMPKKRLFPTKSFKNSATKGSKSPTSQTLSTTKSKQPPQTPEPKTKSPQDTAKYSPHFSQKKRKRLFEQFRTASSSEAPEDIEDSQLTHSCNRIQDFFSRAKSAKLVSCPVCQKQVTLSGINKHLDSGCLHSISDKDCFQEPESKARRTESFSSESMRNQKQEASVSPLGRKIAEVKDDLKDTQTRLRLKRKMKSHSLYVPEKSCPGETSETTSILESHKKPSLCPVRSETSAEMVVRSEYFSMAENLKHNSEVLRSPQLIKSVPSLLSRSSKFLPEDSSSMQGGSSPRNPEAEIPNSLERKVSNASECSTVILSSQSQELPEAQDDVFVMYATSSTNSSSRETATDIQYDTSPDYSRLSISKSGFLKFDDGDQHLTYRSIASESEDVSESEDTAQDSSDITATSSSLGPTGSTSSGIGSQSSCTTEKSSLTLQSEDLSSTNCLIKEDLESDGITPLNWNKDSNLSLPSSQETSTKDFQLTNPADSFSQSSQSSCTSNSPRILVLEKSPTKASSSETLSSGRSPKGTPSKKAAAASSPSNSPWKYRDPYFLANFKLILNTVLACEDDKTLFNKDDMRAIDAFRDLSAPSQQLYVRLFQRKHAWLQVAKLDYQRIAKDLTPVVAELGESDLIETEQGLNDFETVLNLCSAPDLKTLSKTLRLGAPSTGQTKQDIIDAILKHSRQQRSLFASSMEQVLMKKAKKTLGPCLRLGDEPRTIFARVLLLFSLTSDMDDEDKASGGMSQLQTLLLSNMGRVIYPTYKLTRNAKIFATRDDLLRYETALHYENDIASAMSTNDFELAYQLQQKAMSTYQQLQTDTQILDHDLSLPDFLRCFTASWTYTRILYTGVEILQKLRRYAAAVDTLQQLLGQTNYCCDSRGRWWDRLALNLDQHLKKSEQALDAIKGGLGDSYVRTGHRLALQLRAQKILNSTGKKQFKKRLEEFIFDQVREMPRINIEGQVLPYQAPGIKNTFVREWMGERKRDGDMAICRVEEVALEHYKKLGYDEGVHGEGSTFTTLVFLLFWDVIFMEGIPDVFCYPYQSCPLDLRSDAFFTNRQEAIEQRLFEIRQADSQGLQDRLESSWTEYNGEQCTGVSWQLFTDLQQAQGLLVCFGGEFLSAVAGRILKDHRHCRGGMPDLTVWSPQSGKFKLVEVKGPGDRLSQKQILWIDFFLSLGVDAEVCHVTATGSKRLKRSGSINKHGDSASL